jgi:membrane-associated protease RseP (regulator of RpoE activity)
MRHFVLAALAGLLCVPSLWAEPEKPKVSSETKPVTVPFELLKSRHIAVKAKINGKGPYRLIFDTGAPVTLLSVKVGKDTGLLKNAAMPLFAPFGPTAEVKLKTLEVGDLKAENQAAIVMDHPTVQMLANALGPIEGIVGFGFFAHYKTTIDYQAKELTFVPSDFEPPDVTGGLMKTMMKALQDQGDVKIVAPAGQWGLVVTKEAGDNKPGVTIKEVRPDTPAAAAGLKAGDRLLTLDSRWTDSVGECYQAAGQVKPGTAVPVVIQRDGKEMEVTVKPVPGL